MPEERFYVTYNNETIAENCDISTAFMLTKAYFDSDETDMVMAIARWNPADNNRKEHEGCVGCKHTMKKSDDYPCSVCKGTHSDMWEKEQ